MDFIQTGLLTVLPKTVTVLILCYLGCKGIDFLTGILKTLKKQGSYKSRTMRDGLIRWISELVAIVFVIILDVVLGLNFIMVTATLGLFIYKECGSIKENLEECGVDLPKIFDINVDKFNPQNKEEGENGEDK